MGLLSGIFGDDKQDVTTTNEPWSGQIPYLQNIFQQAQNWYQTPREYYPPFNTVSPLNPYQISGMEGMYGYANSPALQSLYSNAFGSNIQGMNPFANPYLSAASQSFQPSQNALIGAMNRSMNPEVGITGASGPTDVYERMMSATPNMDVWNPVMNAVTSNAVQGFRDQILPQISNATQGAGQYMSDPKAGIATGLAADRMSENLNQTLSQMGLSAAQEALGQQNVGAQLSQQNAGLNLQGQMARESALQNLYQQGIGAAGTGLGGFQGLYSPTLSYSAQNIGMSPQMAQLGAYPYSLMTGVGSAYQGQSQAELQDLMNRWTATNQGPYQDLSQYAQLIGGNYGGTSTTPSYTNPAMGALSGGVLGALGGTALGNGALGWIGPGWLGLGGGLLGAMIGAS